MATPQKGILSQPKGVLSQALENLKNAQAVIKAFKGLPKNATNIQTDVGQVTKNLLPSISGMQKKVLSFSNDLENQLKKEIAQLKKGKTDSVPKFATQSKAKIAPINSLIEATLKKCNKASDAINKDSIALQKVNINLSAQIVGLRSSLEGEQKKLDALNEKKYYLLALGLLGAPGLIALAILLKKANDNVASLKRKKSSLKSQIRTQSSFLAQTKNFLKDFSELINKTSGVLNSLGFLLGDINNISTNIKKGKVSNTGQVQLYLAAALIAVNTLRTDAS